MNSVEELLASRFEAARELLADGKWREGWAGWELRLSASPSPNLPWPRWNGEPIAGKRLLLWPDQGLGDKIMLARFIPYLQRAGAQVTALAEPSLVDLFRLNFPGVEIVASSGAAEFTDPDLWIEWFSLPGRLGLTPQNLPGAAYLKAPATGLSLPPGARIGVAVSGNPYHANDAHRSLPADQAARLLGLPGAISLLPEHTGARSFAETAHMIAGLEVVVSVDTSVAHLAGALGKRVLILLPDHRTDWRWMRGRSDTPWYPSAELLRQPASRQWGSVVDEVCRRLARSGE